MYVLYYEIQLTSSTLTLSTLKCRVTKIFFYFVRFKSSYFWSELSATHAFNELIKLILCTTTQVKLQNCGWPQCIGAWSLRNGAFSLSVTEFGEPCQVVLKVRHGIYKINQFSYERYWRNHKRYFGWSSMHWDNKIQKVVDFRKILGYDLF